MILLFCLYFFILPSIVLPQAALAEPDRVRIHHKLRRISDATRAVNKAAREAEEKTRTRGEKKQKMVAAAPAYLKSRVGIWEELPFVKVNNWQIYGEDVMRTDVLEYVTVGGKMPKEVYIDLMEYLVAKWDDARRA